MSRLCRLKTKTHGEDGQWAYEEITKLREQVAAQDEELTKLRLQCISDFGQYVDGTQELQEKIQAQAAVIEKLLEALTKIATARIGKPERWAHALFSDEKIAVEALATPSDSTQILAEVRRAEREKCAKVCDRLSRKEKDHAAGYGFGYLTYTADDCAAVIRAME